MPTLSQRIITRCELDMGKDVYSQPWRTKPGYSDCSWYVRRILMELAGIDPGTYTTAIAENKAGTVITRSKADVLAGKFQEADVILWGWEDDHRAGYPFSHTGFLTHKNEGGSWDQYGDIEPYVMGPDGRKHGHGPNFHRLHWGLDKADRILVKRFIPTESPLAMASAKTAMPLPTSILRKGMLHDDVLLWTTYLHRFYEYAANVTPGKFFGADTERATMEFQRRTGLKPDGIVGPLTWRMGARYGFKGGL